MIYSHRRAKAVDLLHKHELDALILCLPDNIRYLCGFTGSDSALVITADQLVFLTDSRYITQAHDQVHAEAIEQYRQKQQGIIECLQRCGATKIGFEAELPYAIVKGMRTRGMAEWLWLDLDEGLKNLRLCKSAEELAAIHVAAQINQTAFAEIEAMIRPGVRESEIALALEFAMRKQGAEEKAFDLIVASGARGALPHGVASDKKLAEGELVTIDFGCRCHGYHSDETVTIALGDVPDTLREIFDTVLEAHDLAMAAVSPGVALIEIDKIARDHIGHRGYGDYFGHGLGHGVGLQIHEAPVVSPRSKLSAAEGMVFTIEPGVYIPDLGGVRIEDMVTVTNSGVQSLTKIPKTFRNILLD